MDSDEFSSIICKPIALPLLHLKCNFHYLVFFGEYILVLHFKQCICLVPFFTEVLYSSREIMFNSA